MVRNFFLRYACIFLAGAMLAACSSGPQREEPAEGPAESMEEETMDPREEAVRFLVDKYHFTEESLEGIDVEAFISDYRLRDTEYTAEEVWEILEDNREYYLISETDSVFSLLFPTDDVPERGMIL